VKGGHQHSRQCHSGSAADGKSNGETGSDKEQITPLT